MDQGNCRQLRNQVRAIGWRSRLASMLAALALLLPAAAHSKCTLQTAELPVTMVGARAIATVRINGTSVPLMVDSGAFYSMLTDAAAAQLNLRLVPMPRNLVVKGLGGNVRTHTTSVNKLELLGGSIPDVDFIVGGTEPGAGAMGILGRNILSAADTEYDLAHGVIRLVFPGDDCSNANMAYWAGSTPVSEIDLLRDNNDRFKLPEIRGLVKVNGKELLALFDSGAKGTLVSLRAAHEAGVPDGDMKPSGVSYGLDGKPAKSWTAPIATIDLGGEIISNNRLRVTDYDMPQDMLLGVDFFLSHRIYVAKKRRVMFFTYNGGRVFMDNTVAAAAPAASAAASDDPALSADDYARRGAASASRGDYASALADLDRACALAPASAAFFARRGQIRLQLKQPDKAMEDIDKALQIDPLQVDARLQRASMRAFAKNADGALADLAELDKQLAPQAQQRVQMGGLYLGLHAPAPAVAQFDLWIPHHAHEFQIENILYERCWARVQLGVDLDKALDDCDAAVDADAKNPAFLDARAWVYLRQGKLTKARADFNRGLAIKPHNAFLLYGRGLVEQGLGDAAAGQADLDAARKQSASIDVDVGRFGLDAKQAGRP